MSGFTSRYQLVNMAIKLKRMEEENQELIKELEEYRKPKKSIWSKLAFWKGKK